MSVDATRWAWEQQVKPAAKLVLLSLADRAGENHECWPSVSRLESDTGLDRKTIMSSIQAMETLGLLTVTRVQGLGNKYQLVGVTSRETSAEIGINTSPKNGTGTSPKNGTSTEIDTSPKNGTRPVPKTGQGSTKNGTTTSPKNGTLNLKEEPNNNLTKNLKEKTAKNILADYGIEGQIAVDFLAIRKAKKSPLTVTAMDGIAKQANKAGISVIDAVTICARKGWQGFNANWDWQEEEKKTYPQTKSMRIL